MCDIRRGLNSIQLYWQLWGKGVHCNFTSDPGCEMWISFSFKLGHLCSVCFLCPSVQANTMSTSQPKPKLVSPPILPLGHRPLCWHDVSFSKFPFSHIPASVSLNPSLVLILRLSLILSLSLLYLLCNYCWSSSLSFRPSSNSKPAISNLTHFPPANL